MTALAAFLFGVGLVAAVTVIAASLAGIAARLPDLFK